MASKIFRHGFKSNAERLSLFERAELGLTPHEKLDPLALADKHGIRVLSIRELYGVDDDAIAHFCEEQTSEFSAATFYRGTRRIIVFNPSHSRGRRAADICHELSHVFLEHEPEVIATSEIIRDWNETHEHEADWLAGCLLIPKPAAWQCARDKLTLEEIAERFGVSVPMARMRLNLTGTRRRFR